MTRRAFRLVPEAQAELEHEIDYYEARAIGLGGEFFADYEATLERVLDGPRRGTIVSGKSAPATVHRFLFARFPFALYVVDEEDAITIYAVGHQHKKPGYWAGRLEP